MIKLAFSKTFSFIILANNFLNINLIQDTNMLFSTFVMIYWLLPCTLVCLSEVLQAQFLIKLHLSGMESTSLQTTKQSMPFGSLFFFTGHHQGIGHHLRDPFCRAPMSNEIKPVMIPTGSHRAWPGLRWNFQLPPSTLPFALPCTLRKHN